MIRWFTENEVENRLPVRLSEAYLTHFSTDRHEKAEINTVRLTVKYNRRESKFGVQTGSMSCTSGRQFQREDMVWLRGMRGRGLNRSSQGQHNR